MSVSSDRNEQRRWDVLVIGAGGLQAKAMFEAAARGNGIGSWLAADRAWRPDRARRMCWPVRTYRGTFGVRREIAAQWEDLGAIESEAEEAVADLGVTFTLVEFGAPGGKYRSTATAGNAASRDRRSGRAIGQRAGGASPQISMCPRRSDVTL